LGGVIVRAVRATLGFQALAQQGQSPLQPALHTVDRATQHTGDFARRQVFLVAQRHDRPELGRQPGDQPAQFLDFPAVRWPRFRGNQRGCLEVERWLALPLQPARMVDAFPRSDLAEPKYQVRFRPDLAQTLKELQEDVLRKVFGQCRVAEEVPGNAENHALVLLHQPRKCFGIALGRTLQQRGGRIGCQQLCFHMIFLAPNLYTNHRAQRMQNLLNPRQPEK